MHSSELTSSDDKQPHNKQLMMLFGYKSTACFVTNACTTTLSSKQAFYLVLLKLNGTIEEKKHLAMFLLISFSNQPELTASFFFGGSG